MVTDPSCPRLSPPWRGGETRGGERESELYNLWASFSRLFVPKTPARIGRGEGSGRAGRRGRGGAASRLVSSGVWSQGPGLLAPAKRGEPELCGECKEPGGLPARRRRRRPQAQPNEKRADNLFSNPGSGAWRGRVAGLGGGSPLLLPTSRPRPLPAPQLPARSHTFPDN